MINQLITALSQELELSAEEIADTIWLALQIDQFSSEQSDPPQPPLKRGELDQETVKESDPPQPPLKSRELDHPETVKNQSPEEQKAGIYPRNQQQTSKTSGLSLKVPDASSLREPLILARAFKPLMRRVASDQELVLDEIATVATAQKIGDKVLCFPVFKPTLEPWLDLELVIDESISMQIWRHTIKELEKLLKNYGIFRDVRVWGLITDKNKQVKIRRGIGASSKNQSPRSPKELIDPSGRRLVLVVSDCVSSLWRSGKVTPVLELWAKQGSIAILQMLPKWMWKRTALGWATEVWLRALSPGVFNQNLIAQKVSLWDELDGGVKVPVFTLEPDKAGNWAQMLAGKGSIWVSGYVFKLDTIPVKNESELLNLAGDLSAEHRVQGFRVTASPMARKLAGLLASAPVITLPIVRLIQETFLKDSLQVNVAEVFLGGLLKPLSEINAETNPDQVQYDFMEGVRELLLDSVPSNYVLNVIDEVSNYVAKKLNFSLENFAAVLKKEQPVINSDIVEEVGYFATVTAQVLRRLGGEYVKVAEELDKHNQKINDKEQVKVKQYWLFQGNPKYYRVLDSIHDFEQMYWLVTRYTEDIAVGDGVLIWSAGKKAGIYAIGEVIEPVKTLNKVPDDNYWIIKKMSQPNAKRVLIYFTAKLLDNPILYQELIQNNILNNLSVISDPRGTNFKLKQEQWMQIYELRKLYILFELKTILLVEDQIEVIEKVSKKLSEKYNIVVQSSDDINELIQLAESETIDLILINYQLPNSRYQGEKLNGIEVVRILKDNPNISPYLPIIGFSVEIHREKEFLQYADGFYDKGTFLEWEYDPRFVHYIRRIFYDLKLKQQQEQQNVKDVDYIELQNLLTDSNVITRFELENKKNPTLQTVTFETVTVNRQGEIIKTETKQAQYFTEILPDNILLEMIAIPGGTFMMGRTEAERNTKDESPQHQVTVKSFFIGKYEITQAQWRIIANRNELKVNRDLNPNPSFFKDDNRPVDSVNWYEALEFCDRLSKLTERKYRLPSEAEWEYACRAGTTTPFTYGETLTDKLANYNATINYADEPIGQYRQETTPVGSFYPNNFGLYDMHGNVWEWCLDDWHDNYKNAPNDGSAWIDNLDEFGNYQQVSERGVLRGGCWNGSITSSRCANRHSSIIKRKNRTHSRGFRVVCVSETHYPVKAEKELDKISKYSQDNRVQ